MTPGVFVKFVAEVTGVKHATVMLLHRAIVARGSFKSCGRGMSASDVDREDAASLLVAICAKHCHMTVDDVSLYVAVHGEARRYRDDALAAMTQGQSLVFKYNDGGDLTHTCVISARAIRRIAVEALLPDHPGRPYVTGEARLLASRTFGPHEIAHQFRVLHRE